MRRKLLELAGEQAGKAGLKPLRPLDDEQIVDHLHDAHVGAGLKPEQYRHIFPLPPEIARVEQHVAGARHRGRLQWWQRQRPPSRKKPLHHSVEPKHAQQDIGNVIVARVGEQRPQSCQAHALGESGPETSNRRGTTLGPVEIGQKTRIDAVEGIAAQHPRHEFHLGGVALRKRRDQLLGHPLDAGGMAEIGVPVDDPRYVEQDSARPFLSAVGVAAVGRWLLVQRHISDRRRGSCRAGTFLPSIRRSVNRWRLQPQSHSPNIFTAFQLQHRYCFYRVVR
jgi:hypothetical protein